MDGEGTCRYRVARISHLCAKELPFSSMVASGTVVLFISRCLSRIVLFGHSESRQTCDETAVLPDTFGHRVGP